MTPIRPAPSVFASERLGVNFVVIWRPGVLALIISRLGRLSSLRALEPAYCFAAGSCPVLAAAGLAAGFGFGVQNSGSAEAISLETLLIFGLNA